MSYIILSNLIVERADVYKTPTGTRRFFMPDTHLVESIGALRAKKISTAYFEDHIGLY